MPDYNPDSIDAVVSRIETTLNEFVRESKEWRDSHEARLKTLHESVQSHDRLKYWFLGIAAAGGVAGGKLLAMFTGGPRQ